MVTVDPQRVARIAMRAAGLVAVVGLAASCGPPVSTGGKASTGEGSSSSSSGMPTRSTSSPSDTTAAEMSTGERPPDDDCPVGTSDCPCSPDGECEEGFACALEFNLCLPPTCVDEASPDTNLTLVEGERVTTLEVAWFDYWSCSLYAGLVFKPIGVEFNGSHAPPEGRMFIVGELLEWDDVEPGVVSTLELDVPGKGKWPDYGTVEITDIVRSGSGHPLELAGSIDAGDEQWSLTGTFRATQCGFGWGPHFPCR